MLEALPRRSALWRYLAGTAPFDDGHIEHLTRLLLASHEQTRHVHYARYGVAKNFEALKPGRPWEPPPAATYDLDPEGQIHMTADQFAALLRG